MTTIVEDMALAELRIKLFGAAQLLKGDGLDELKTLVTEVAQVLDIEINRPLARMAKQLELKAAIEEVRRAVHCLSLEVPSSIQQAISARVEAAIALALDVPDPRG